MPLQQVNQGKFAPLVGTYYVPPPDEPRNLATAFMSGFLRTRTPHAQAVFAKRLEALDPSAQAAALAAADASSVELAGQAREWEKDQQTFKSDLDKYAVEMYKADSDVYRAFGVANIEAGAKLAEARLSADVKLAEMAEVTPKMKTKEYAALKTTADTAAAKAKGYREAYARALKGGADAATLETLKGNAEAAARTFQTSRLKIVKWAGESGDFGVSQLNTLDTNIAELGRSLDATPEMKEFDDNLQAWGDRLLRDQQVLPSYSPVDTSRYAAGGAAPGRPARPELTGGGTVGTETGTSGPAKLPEWYDRAQSGIDDTKKRIGELYDNPYGGFNDPLPGTERGILGGRGSMRGPSVGRREAMAAEAAQTQATARSTPAGPAAGTAAAAAATPPSAADAARRQAYEAAQAMGPAAPTRSEQTATDLDELDRVLGNRSMAFERVPDQADADPYYRGTIAR